MGEIAQVSCTSGSVQGHVTAISPKFRTGGWGYNTLNVNVARFGFNAKYERF